MPVKVSSFSRFICANSEKDSAIDMNTFSFLVPEIYFLTVNYAALKMYTSVCICGGRDGPWVCKLLSVSLPTSAFSVGLSQSSLGDVKTDLDWETSKPGHSLTHVLHAGAEFWSTVAPCCSCALLCVSLLGLLTAVSGT